MKKQGLENDTMDNSGLKNFSYSFDSSKPAKEIFDLLLQVGKWWTGFYEETVTGKSEKVGDEFEFLTASGVHYSRHKLTELVPNERIVWEVTDSKLSFISKTDEWSGTKLRFDISDKGNSRQVSFTHEGLITEFECYDACSGAWTGYLKELEIQLK